MRLGVGGAGRAYVGLKRERLGEDPVLTFHVVFLLDFHRDRYLAIVSPAYEAVRLYNQMQRTSLTFFLWSPASPHEQGPACRCG